MYIIMPFKLIRFYFDQLADYSGIFVGDSSLVKKSLKITKEDKS